MVEYFNRYAYIEIGECFKFICIIFTSVSLDLVALYGKPYIPAAKDTWRLFKDRGIDALINDSLTGMGTFNCWPQRSPLTKTFW